MIIASEIVDRKNHLNSTAWLDITHVCIVSDILIAPGPAAGRGRGHLTSGQSPQCSGTERGSLTTEALSQLCSPSRTSPSFMMKVN